MGRVSGSQQETEIKLPVADAAAARRLLRRAGFRVSRRRVFEANTVFDTAESQLRQNGELLRLREAGRVFTVTYKGVAKVSRHKSREEVEFGVTDSAAMTRVLQRLGFHPVFRYEKYRTEFEQPGARGIATVDETPLGVYLELEGAPRWIDRTARTLGYAEEDYITESYGRLYLNWCEQNSLPLGNMVFGQRRFRARSTFNAKPTRR
jgi:adenylate cyclase class 2